MNKIEIFNESIIVIGYYMCYLFTDFVEPEVRNLLGWCCIGLIFANIVVNMGGMIKTTVVEI
jgi:hypothetical protein